MRKTSSLTILALLAAACGPSTTTTTKKDTDKVKTVPVDPKPATTTSLPSDPNKPLPLFHKVKKGVLANGLTYFVRANKAPEKRGEFWLVVNAGSFHEEENQRGLAHFVEHMAFNGTKSFPKNQLISELRNLGVKFGPHINAYTSFDETVYKLRVPTDDPKAVALAMKILAEWAQDVTFTDKDVNEERGVVLGEKRSRSGPQARMAKKLLGKVFPVSKYGKRLPIGLPEVIKKAPASLLKKFYKDWYHPGNMAVIAVGDFDPVAIEKQIKAQFSALKKRVKPRPQPSRAISKRTDMQILKLADKEIPVAAVVLGRVIPATKNVSMADMRRDFIEKVSLLMLTQRLNEARKRGNASYLQAGAIGTGLVRAAHGIIVFGAAAASRIKPAFADILTEIERIRRHGFLNSEMKRATAKLRAAMRQMVKEENASTESSSALVAELVRHFLTGEAAAGRVMERSLVEHFSKTVKLSELQAFIGNLISAKDLRIATVAPSKDALMDKKTILAELASVKQKRIVAYTDKKSTEPLIATAPTPGTIAKTKVYKKIGVTEWTLSNGAKVVLKPTIFKSDQILFRATSPGGRSLQKPSELRTTHAAAAIIQRSGLGKFDSVALEKRLAGYNVSISPYIRRYAEGFSGSSSVEDFETLLQLAYLGFTAPRKDEKAFKVWRENAIETIKLSNNLPDKRFSDKLSKLLFNKNPRRYLPTEKVIKGVDLDKAFAFYKDRLKDASDFTFFIVGDFNIDKVKPLILKYLGSLPKVGRKETYKLHKWRVHKRRQRLVMKGGTAQRARMSFHFVRPVRGKLTPRDRAAFSLWAEAFSYHMIELFREKLGATYGVGVRPGFPNRRTRASLVVRFDAEPKKRAKLEKMALAEITKAVRRGIKKDFIEKAKKAALKDLETGMTDNRYWRSELEEAYFDGKSPTQILTWKGLIKKLTPKQINASARRYVWPNRPIIGILHP